MRKVHTIELMKSTRHGWRSEGKRIGFVPTMGAIHDGHLSLVGRARQECDVVVVSIFVNPIQFGPREDYRRYPRTPEADAKQLEAAGVDVLFLPSAEEMYPKGFATYVEVQGLSDLLCGRFRPGHFRGVTTVVLKLLAIVAPHRAYFGQKDAQQSVILRKMARDLNLDVEIVICPTVRDEDGLALSSRNAYLSERERRAATVLYRALQEGRRLIEGGVREARRIQEACWQVLSSEPLAKPEYAEVVDPDSLAPLVDLKGQCLLAVAARIGAARLIDSIVVEVPGGENREE